MTRRTAAYLGLTVGIHGWLLGASILCVAGGYYAVLAEIVAIGLPISIAMSALGILVMECVVRLFGRGRVFTLSLWGLILFALGVLILLINHWLAPLIETEPGLVDLLSRLGAVYKTSDVVPALCLLGSGVLLFVSVRACLRHH
jgi:hypothetical protein